MMYCKYCGAQIADDALFCQQCGKELNPSALQEDIDPLAAQEKAWADPTQEIPVETIDPAVEAKKDELAGNALKWGILSLAFANSCILSLLGFIFSFIAKKNAREYELAFGELEVRAKLGRIFGIIGFVIGLIFSILAVLYFLVFFLVLLVELMPY